MKILWLFAVTAMVLLGACSSKNSETGSADANANPVEFVPYIIEDSSKLLSYANGVKVYTVLDGPGQFPRQSMSMQFHYQGMLQDGKVFDSSYKRGQPLKVRMGEGEIIQGLEYALQKMRFGTKAIVVVPPELAYGAREDVTDIPPNSTLTFHVEVLGAF